MNLVIPYRHDDHDGYELKHCIRSMVKHFTDLTGVTIIGDKPKWYTGEHIKAKDGPRKEWNIVSKILMSPYPQFLLCSDDVFATQDFDATLPMYYSERLDQVKYKGQYPTRAANTMKVYPDGMMYDIHKPMVIDRALFREAQLQGNWAQREYLSKSMYGNYVGGGEVLADHKVRHAFKCDLTKPFFSTNGGAVAKMLKLHELYPLTSVYEKYFVDTPVSDGLIM